jgi:nucleoside-diphosphate-sugar epimerase
VRLLLTGSGGFTGRYLYETAQKSGFEVFSLKADITDVKSLHSEVSEVAPTHVAHLAAISAVTHADEEAFYRVNVLGTQNLLSALDVLSQRPKKVLLASSANVYGNSLVSPITEGECPAPVNHYAISKLAMEFMAATFFQRLPIIIARPFNYTGVGHDTRFVVPKIIDHFKRRASEIELGNINVLREYNDVRMVCQAYLGLLQLGESGQTYNIASGRTIALQTVISDLEEITGHKMKVNINPAFIRANEIEVLSGCSQKIESLLDPLAHPPIKDTLTWMLGH